ncbi:MAG: hypothetical protein Q4C02_07240 [Eubacteriales bacterium]|nr:hypothetical protein [Sarcina sp.]MBR2730187.1 hypothetical protein [Lachnospiraceae bacterium]MDO4418056.1 hypothetical protein [Eubacteriales bacterium]
MSAAATGKMIAICDSDLSYASRLMEYLRMETGIPAGIRLYTSAEKLLEDPAARKAALLVIAQSQYSEAVAEAGFPELLLLSEDDVWQGEEPENISKYQSISNIVICIRSRCAAGEESVVSMRHGKPMVRIGVYTPVTRCLQTTFTLTLGQILARQHKVLYMNFEAFSGFERMLQREFQGSVSDLIYYNECAREKLAGQLEMMTEEVGGLHFLPPLKSFVELRSIRKEQWSSLLRTIEKVTEYEFLLLDLTEHTDGLLDILRNCDRVYTIVRDDTFSRARYLQYEDILRRMDYEDVRMRTQHWRFPLFRELPRGIEDLTRGELAAYIREHLLEGPD